MAEKKKDRKTASEKKDSLWEYCKIFAKECREIHRQIAPWFYTFIAGFLIGGGLTYVILDSNELYEENLPQAQIVASTYISIPAHSFAYNGKTRSPSWVLEVLTHGPDNARINPSNVRFYEDTSIPAVIRPGFKDYQNSGFDMGSLFSSSNSELPLSMASPQLSQFNKGYWAKVNAYIYGLMDKLEIAHVLVISGPLYLPHKESDGKQYVTYRVIGESQIAVPTHFFKAVFYPTYTSKGSASSFGSEFYIIPNQNLSESVPLESFRTSLEELEKKSGVIFPKDIMDYLTPNFVPAPR